MTTQTETTVQTATDVPTIYAETVRTTLKDALTLVNRHVSANRMLPSLANVRITADAHDQTVTVDATNLDVDVRVTVLAVVTAGGTFLIDRKVLAGIVKAGADVTTFEVVDNGPNGFGSATIRNVDVTGAGSSSSVVPTGILADYPNLPDVPEASELIGRDVLDILGRSVLTASVDDGRPVLTGVRFGPTSSVFGADSGTEVATTDSYGLTVGRIGADMPEGLVPADTIRKVAGWKTDLVSVGSTGDVAGNRRYGFEARITQGPKRDPRVLDVALTVRTIEGSFPNYPLLMPERDVHGWTLTVDRDEWIGAANGLAGFVGKRNGAIASLVTITDGQPVTLSVTVDGSTSTVPVRATVDGNPIDVPIGFNARFVVRALEAQPAGPVVLSFRDGLKPCRVDGADGQTVGLLMPMRIR